MQRTAQVQACSPVLSMRAGADGARDRRPFHVGPCVATHVQAPPLGCGAFSSTAADP